MKKGKKGSAENETNLKKTANKEKIRTKKRQRKEM